MLWPPGKREGYSVREADLHQQVTDYLRIQYRNVMFHTDFAAGVKLTMGQAVKNKRLQSGRAWPDLFIAEPRGKFHGLFLELKREGTKIVKRDGFLVADPHIKEQAATINHLLAQGYWAEFAVGFDHAKKIIDTYLSPSMLGMTRSRLDLQGPLEGEGDTAGES